MNFSNLFGASPPKLERVLQYPTKYREPAIVEAILHAACTWLHCTPVILQRVDAVRDKPGTVARQAAQHTATSIRKGVISELTVTKGRFLGHFDNALLLVYRNTPALRQRIDQFVYNSCRWMTADSRLSSGLAEPLRLDVYQDSFAKMSRLMRDPQFTFERSAGVFLRRLYRDRCIDAIRHRDTLKESQGRQNADLEGLSERARRKLSQPPFELVDDMLNLVKRKYPRCFALLRRLDEGYSYEELSHEFGKLAGALRKEAYRCRQKLYNYSQSLGYDG